MFALTSDLKINKPNNKNLENLNLGCAYKQRCTEMFTLTDIWQAVIPVSTLGVAKIRSN